MTAANSLKLNVKSSLLRLLLVPGAAAPFSMLMRGRATIIMFHRFRVAELGLDGHDPDEVRAALAYLRKRKHKLIPVDAMIAAIRDGRVEEKSVAFTIDDGYFDHGTVAAPLFAEFDCPVTTFVATGFIDGALWYWWDKVEYVFTNTRRNSLRFGVGESTKVLEWKDRSERAAAHLDFEAFCKIVPDPEKHQWIAALAEAAEVPIPENVPPVYRPMTWNEMRACERSGMTFGAHTVTHPILSRTSDEQSHSELADSWQRLKACVAHPCPVFCYPNGQLGDFGDREVRTLESQGLAGAVVGYPGFPGKSLVSADPSAIFRVPRMAFAGPLAYLVQDISGLERLKQLARGAP